MNSYSIEQLKILVEFLGKMLGRDYEIVLHDLRYGNNSIVAIANGHISKRKIGGPITDIFLKAIENKEYENHDFIVNYKSIGKTNKPLRSSTLYIKDENGVPYALLCINFDDSRFVELCDKALSIAHPMRFLKKYNECLSRGGNDIDELPDITEQLAPDIDTLRDNIYLNVVSSINLPEERLNQEERVRIIKLLDEHGFFKLKGAVAYLSRKFECSSASIYRYLGEAKE